MRAVGLTGGIASGKSVVARLLAERHGVPVLDADRVARDVVAPGSSVLRAIVAAFGPGVLGPDGALDRAALGARITADPEARRRLEALTHPAIWTAVERWLADRAAEGHPLAAVEAALIVETGQAGRFDVLVAVDAPDEARIARLAASRGMDGIRARAWLAAQGSADEKSRAAHVVLVNDGTLEDLAAALEAAWSRIRGEPGPSP